ncbi:MAG: CapA family protein [bacterium]|nr:CapA family protein [bacterium]
MNTGSHFDVRGLFFVIRVTLLCSVLFLAASRADFFLGDSTFEYSKEALVINADTVGEKIEDTPEKDIVTLAFVGDIMLDRGVEAEIIRHAGGKFSFPFEFVKEEFLKYDLVFGNLEGVISDKGFDRRDLYSFRMNVEALPALKEAGFDILSVANNHSDDWGREAFEDMLGRFKSEGIVYVGGGFTEGEAYGGKSVKINDLKITFLAFSDFDTFLKADGAVSGEALIDEEKLANYVGFAQIQNDIVVVSFHFGEEYQSLPNKRQIQLSRLAIEAGADLVVGHHPHVIQPLEKYQNRYIAYSLGNFIFDQYFSDETMEGGLLEVEIEGKSIKNARLKKVLLNKHYQPSLEK